MTHIALPSQRQGIPSAIAVGVPMACSRIYRITAPDSGTLLANRRLRFLPDRLVLAVAHPAPVGTDVEVEIHLERRDILLRLSAVVTGASVAPGYGHELQLRVTKAIPPAMRWIAALALVNPTSSTPWGSAQRKRHVLHITER